MNFDYVHDLISHLEPGLRPDSYFYDIERMNLVFVWRSPMAQGRPQVELFRLTTRRDHLLRAHKHDRAA